MRNAETRFTDLFFALQMLRSLLLWFLLLLSSSVYMLCLLVFIRTIPWKDKNRMSQTTVWELWFVLKILKGEQNNLWPPQKVEQVKRNYAAAIIVVTIVLMVVDTGTVASRP